MPASQGREYGSERRLLRQHGEALSILFRPLQPLDICNMDPQGLGGPRWRLVSLGTPPGATAGCVAQGCAHRAARKDEAGCAGGQGRRRNVEGPWCCAPGSRCTDTSSSGACLHPRPRPSSAGSSFKSFLTCKAGPGKPVGRLWVWLLTSVTFNTLIYEVTPHPPQILHLSEKQSLYTVI